MRGELGKVKSLRFQFYTVHGLRIAGVKGPSHAWRSGRWLKFPAGSSGHFKDGEYILMKVMTKGKNGKDKIICKLVVTREDLLDAINSVRCPSQAK